MFSFNLTGLGTSWSIIIDTSRPPNPHLSSLLQQQLIDFEAKYSRFLPTSQLSLLNSSPSSSNPLPYDLLTMIELGLKLKSLSHGHFDLNIATQLENIGYDQDYSFTPKTNHHKQTAGTYHLKNNHLIRRGQVKLDLGSLGKGYLIDQLAKTLHQHQTPHFLIDGGGDLYGTTKRNLSPWRIAIEHPLDPNIVIASLDLNHQAIATSTSQKRRFGSFHHLLDAKKITPVNAVLSLTTLSSSAFTADAVATALFVTPCSLWSTIIQHTQTQYLALDHQLKATNSPNFPAKILYSTQSAH